MSTDTTTTAPATKEALWATRLDNEQLAARLITLANEGVKAQSLLARQAIYREAARRLFDGTPQWKATRLPSQRELDLHNGVAPAADQAPAADAAPPADLQAALAASIDRAGKPDGQVPSTRRSRSAKAGK